MPNFKITDNQTGKTVTISGENPPSEQEAEQIFKDAGLREEEKSPNLVQRAFNLIDTPSNVVGGIIKDGRKQFSGEYKAPDQGVFGANIPLTKIGGKEDVKIGELIAPGLVGAGRGLKAALTGEQGSDLFTQVPGAVEDMTGRELSPVAKIGLGLGAELLTPDLADAVSFLKARKSLSKGEKVASVGEKTTQKVSNALEDFSNFLGLKTTGITKGQAKSFYTKTGKKAEDVIRDEKLYGNVVETLSNKLTDLQKEYDDIAINSGLKLGPDEVKAAIDGRISKLSESVSSTNANKVEIKALEELKNDLLTDISQRGGQVGIEFITDLKRMHKEAAGNQALVKAVLGGKKTPDAVKELMLMDIANNVGSQVGPLKEIGKRLKSLYSLDEIAKAQNLGSGSKIFSLTNILTGAAAAGGAAQGDSVPEKVGMALAAVGLKKMADNPVVVGKISDVLINSSDALKESKAFPALIDLIIRGTKETTIQAGQDLETR